MLGWFRQGPEQKVGMLHSTPPVSACSAESAPEDEATYTVPSAPMVGDAEMAPPSALLHRTVPLGLRQVTNPVESPNTSSDDPRGETAIRPGCPGGVNVQRIRPYASVAFTEYTMLPPGTYTLPPLLEMVGDFQLLVYTMVLIAQARVPLAKNLWSQLAL